MSFPTESWFFDLAAVALQQRCLTRSRRCWASLSNRARECGPECRGRCLEGRVRILVFDDSDARRRRGTGRVDPGCSAPVRILATSREGLGVADEQLWLVPSLDADAHPHTRRR